MQGDLLHLWQIMEAQLCPDQSQFAQHLPRIDDAQRLDEITPPVLGIRLRLLTQQIAVLLLRGRCPRQCQKPLQDVRGVGVLIAKEQKRQRDLIRKSGERGDLRRKDHAKLQLTHLLGKI